MSAILDFSIHGLAGRRQPLRAHLNPGVNVFWGLNGRGKTSLLKILHSSLQADAANLLRVPFKSAEVTIGIGDGKEGRLERRRIVKEDDLPQAFQGRLVEGWEEERFYSSDEERWAMETKLARSASSLAWISGSDEPTRQVFHRYLPISRVSEIRPHSGRPRPVVELFDEAAFDQVFAEQIHGIWQECNSRALMSIRSIQEEGLAAIISAVLSPSSSPVAIDLDALEAFDLIRSYFKEQRRTSLRGLHIGSKNSFVERYYNEGGLRQIVAEVAEVQRKVEEAQEPQQRIESLVADLFSGNKRVDLGARQLRVMAGKTEIPVESLSSGEKQLLRILLECLGARRSPILIDEPELSMHVDWQYRLVECMQLVNPEAQIILATHSPEIMATLPDHCIFEL